MDCFLGNHPIDSLYHQSYSDWVECSKIWALIMCKSKDRLEHRYQEWVCVKCGKTVKQNNYRKMKLG